MFSSPKMLRFAQSFLLIGSISLVFASFRLFNQALDLGLSSKIIFTILPVSILSGVIKARLVMRKRMLENVSRLQESQVKLWPWDIYPRPLFVFIFAMIMSMLILKRLFIGNALGLGLLGGLDLAVATALVVSSREYCNK